MIRSPFVIAAAISVALAFSAPAFAGPEALDEEYLILATRRAGTLEDELNEAGASNYRVVAAWRGGTQDELVVFLRRGDATSGQRHYRVLEEIGTGTLNAAAAQGFRVFDGGLFRNTGVLIMERGAGEAERSEYRVVDSVTQYEWSRRQTRWIRDLSGVVAELARIPQDGFRLVGMLGLHMGDGHVHHILIEERLGASNVAGPDQYRLISERPGAAMQQQIDQAAAEGYRLRFGWAVLVPMPHHLSLIMERQDGDVGTYEYLLTGSGNCCVGAQVGAAAQSGYRPHPQGFFGVPDNYIMERGPLDRTPYELRWISTTGTDNFQSDAMAAEAEGFEMIAASDLEGVVYHGEERWSRNSSTHLGLMVRPIESAESSVAFDEDTAPTGRLTIGVEATEKGDKIADLLNEAAGGGHRVVNVAAFHNGENFAEELAFTLERRAETPQIEYRVLTTKRVSSMEKDLNKAAGEGFRLVPGGLFAKPAFLGVRENAAVVERTPQSVAQPVEYRLLATRRWATLLEEIAEAKSEGYAMVARTYVAENIAYMERPAGDQDK